MSDIQVDKFEEDGVVQIWFGRDQKIDHSKFADELIAVDFNEDGDPIGIELIGSAVEDLREQLNA